MPLVGTLLASPLIIPASLFLSVYGHGVYGDFWILFLGSALFSVGSVPLGAILVGVPFDLWIIQRRSFHPSQIALIRSLAYAVWGAVSAYFIYLIVTHWLLTAPPPRQLLPSLFIWFPLGGIIVGVTYTLYEQFIEHMHTSSRLAQELIVARTIQQDLFPKQSPDIEGLIFAVHCEPARETGGDFYDYVRLGPRRVGIVIADVAGKSIPAALLMANARSIWRAAATTGADPHKVLELTNQALCQDISSSTFVTLCYTIIDVAENCVHLASAGHPPPILCSPRSKALTAEVTLPDQALSLIELNANGLPLGLTPDAKYVQSRTILNPGDCLILYTDGIVETLNLEHEMFGFERLYETIRQEATNPPQTVLDNVLSAVQKFSRTTEQLDDRTMLAIQLDQSEGSTE
jgi:serine phosphatase RsbU (regulator of sigma subunit)